MLYYFNAALYSIIFDFMSLDAKSLCILFYAVGFSCVIKYDTAMYYIVLTCSLVDCFYQHVEDLCIKVRIKLKAFSRSSNYIDGHHEGMKKGSTL